MPGAEPFDGEALCKSIESLGKSTLKLASRVLHRGSSSAGSNPSCFAPPLLLILGESMRCSHSSPDQTEPFLRLRRASEPFPSRSPAGGVLPSGCFLPALLFLAFQLRCAHGLQNWWLAMYVAHAHPQSQDNESPSSPLHFLCLVQAATRNHSACLPFPQLLTGHLLHLAQHPGRGGGNGYPWFIFFGHRYYLSRPIQHTAAARNP